MKRGRIDKIIENELDDIVRAGCDCCCKGKGGEKKDLVPALDDAQILIKLIQDERNPKKKRAFIKAYNELNKFV